MKFFATDVTDVTDVIPFHKNLDTNDDNVETRYIPCGTLRERISTTLKFIAINVNWYNGWFARRL
jgi:hypothetical protein